MKTHSNSRIRVARHLQGIPACLTLVLAVCSLASCGTNSAGKPISNPVAMKSGHWFKARSQPPTYFPKGFPADHPTTAADGFWVETGDTAGSRYFIPDDRSDGKMLYDEALSMRSEKILRECAEDERKRRNRKVQNYAMLIPLNLVLAIGQTGVSEEDFDCARTRWFE
jgi:hypothetical protein